MAVEQRPGRLVFMGSPDFALPCLRRLLQDGHEVPLVLSQPDRPAGRGRSTRPTAVSAWTRKQGLALRTPERLRDADLRAELAALQPDLFVVVAYRILPPRLIAIPPLGAVNLHASLLPAYRGAAPIQRALMDGRQQTGLSTFLIERGVDTGRILLQEELAIGDNETFAELHDRMLEVGPGLLSRTVTGLLAGTLESVEQSDAGSCPAPRLSPEDRRLDPALDARELHNRIRALSPVPGAQLMFRDRVIKVLRSRVLDEGRTGTPGELSVTERCLRLQCGRGQLELVELAPAGKRPLRVADWLNGAQLRAGERMLPLPIGGQE